MASKVDNIGDLHGNDISPSDILVAKVWGSSNINFQFGLIDLVNYIGVINGENAHSWLLLWLMEKGH